MNLKSFFSNVAIATLFLASFTACSDDECNLEHLDKLVGSPAVEKGTFPLEGVQIPLGDSIVFAPQLVDTTGISYSWQLNGKEVSTAAHYVYNAKQLANSTLTFSAQNNIGKLVLESKITISGEYKDQFYILNEGWFGHENGNISFFNGKQIIPFCFMPQNGGKTLGVTTQSATEWNGKLYICSKEGINLVIANTHTLIETGRIENVDPEARNFQVNAFIGLNKDYGVLTTTNGLYRIDLNTLVLKKVSTLEGMGEGIVHNNKLFINRRYNKTIAFEIADLTKTEAAEVAATELNIKNIGYGFSFAKAKDGTLWTVEVQNASWSGNTCALAKINNDLTVTKTALSMPLAYDNSVYKKHQLCVSSTENSLVFAGKDKIYKHTIDNSTTTPLVEEKPEGFSFYGAGIGLNSKNNQIVATYVKDGWGENFSFNKLIIYDGSTGVKILENNYSGYYFPAQIIFN